MGVSVSESSTGGLLCEHLLGPSLHVTVFLTHFLEGVSRSVLNNVYRFDFVLLVPAVVLPFLKS